MGELKPCPFCGTAPIVHEGRKGVQCGPGCWIGGSVMPPAAWNHRPEEDRLRKDLHASVNRCQEAEGSLLEKAGLGRAVLASMVDQLEEENDRLRAEVERLGKQLDSWCRWYGEGADEAPHVAEALKCKPLADLILAAHKQFMEEVREVVGHG